MTVPVDLTSFKDLDELTSGWLQQRVFGILRERRNTTRS